MIKCLKESDANKLELSQKTCQRGVIWLAWALICQCKYDQYAINEEYNN